MLLLLTATASMAQISKVEPAIAKGDLKAAKTAFDIGFASDLEKLVKKGKGEADLKSIVWLTKGKLYKAIAFSDNPADATLAPNALEVAIESFNKVLAMEKPTAPNAIFADQFIQEMYATAFNKAVAAYNEDDMPNALKYFDQAWLVNPQDTLVAQNALMIAYQLGEKERTQQISKKLIDAGFTKPFVYLFQLQQAMEENNYEKGLAIIKEARKHNPGDNELLMQEINLYLRMERYEEALSDISVALEAEPNNLILAYNRGLILERVGRPEEALGAYKRCIEIDPNYTDAYYGLAVYHYNQAADANRQLNDLPMDSRGRIKDLAKEEELMNKMKESFNNSLPYFEKLISLKPTDRTYLELIQRVYNGLERRKDVDRIEAILKQLPEEDN